MYLVIVVMGHGDVLKTIKSQESDDFQYLYLHMTMSQSLDTHGQIMVLIVCFHCVSFSSCPLPPTTPALITNYKLVLRRLFMYHVSVHMAISFSQQYQYKSYSGTKQFCYVVDVQK